MPLNSLMTLYKEERSKLTHPILCMTFIIVAYFIVGAFLEAGLDNFVTKHYGVQDMSYITIIQNVITTGFALLLVLLSSRYLSKHSFNSLGFIWSAFPTNYLKGMGIGLAMFSLCVGIGMVLGVQSLSINTGTIEWGMWLAFFGLFFVQGMSEEVIFRSFLLSEISAKHGLAIGLTISNVLFALFHAGNGGAGYMAMVNMFFFGLVMSLAYYYTQNIWVSSAMHGIWNFAEGNIFGISISGHEVSNETILNSKFTGSELLNGGAFGLEGGIICSLGLIISIVVCVVIYRRKSMKG